MSRFNMKVMYVIPVLMLLMACEPNYTRKQTEAYLGDLGIIDSADIQRENYYSYSRNSQFYIHWQDQRYKPLKQQLSAELANILQRYFGSARAVDSLDSVRYRAGYRMELAMWYWDDYLNMWQPINKPLSLNAASTSVPSEKPGILSGSTWKKTSRITKSQTGDEYRTRTRISIYAQPSQQLLDSIEITTDTGIFSQNTTAIVTDNLYDAFDNVARQLAGIK